MEFKQLSPVVAYRFGACEINLQRRVLLVGSRERYVGDKTFDLLVALIENRYRVVSRDELVRVGWGTGVVSDTVLSRAINRCRQSIEDTSKSLPNIRAFWGQGYRFTSEVEVVLGSPVEEHLPAVVQGEGRATLRLAVLPSAVTHAGAIHAMHEAMGHELVLVLSSETGVALCAADRVRALLRDISPSDHLAQAQKLWSELGSVTALSVELTGAAPRLTGHAILLGPDGSVVRANDVRGTDASSLAKALVRSIDRYLAPETQPQAPLDLPDAFTVEAFWRASGAADQWRWQQAQRLALVVCDQAPESLSAQLLLLRTLLRTDTQAALQLGERLLRQAGHRIAPEYLASIHMAIGQALSQQVDEKTQGGAMAHLQCAVQLAQGQPAAAWTARVHLAAASMKMLGDFSSREQAAVLLEKAAAIAQACGNCLLASTARSQLAYLLHHDGHITRSLSLHEPVIEHVLAHELDGRASFFLGMKAECVRAWGELDWAQVCLDSAWQCLERLVQEDRPQPAAYLAYVQSALSLDRGCTTSLQQALMSAPRIEDCHPRHRVHLAVALARGSFAKGHWGECQQWLSRGLREAQEHDLPQMVCPPSVVGLQMALAMHDHASVEMGAKRLETLHDSQQRVATRAEAARARAWLALEDGQVHSAARLLAQLAVCAHESYYVYLARLDAAWLALRLGSCDQASKLLLTSAHWTEQTSVGQLTAMAVHLTQGRAMRAQDSLTRARELWRGRWPAAWSDAESAMFYLGTRLPTNVLLRLSVGSAQDQSTSSEGAECAPDAAEAQQH